MEVSRAGVIAVIFLAAAAGIWAQGTTAPANLSAENIRHYLEKSGLSVTDTFLEPLTGTTGYEVSIQDCPQPLAVLPIPTTFAAVPPSDFRYRQGEFRVSYVFYGHAYPSTLSSSRLSLLRMSYRVGALFGLANAAQLTFYFKIWTPLGCSGLSKNEISKLGEGKTSD